MQTTQFQRFLHRSFVILFFLISASANAALPAADGQGRKLPSLAPMLEGVMPAVVNIATSGKVRVQESPLFSDPFFRHFFDRRTRPRERRTQSLGSGVVIDAKQGYILTNFHVIARADKITVTLVDSRQLDAKLIGADPETDIAVIQVKNEGLTALPLANSNQLRVGDFVVAIGNPFGLGQTVTSGIVSALDRSGLGIEGYENFIQTDASINPGNSGGALVNLAGELVGINTAIFSRSGGNIGIGFAIPANMANDIKQQLIQNGKVQRGRLGAQAQDLTPQLAKAFNIRRGQGAVVTKIAPGSAADRAGLQVSDIILEINGKRVKNSAMLRNNVGLLRIGDTVTLKIVRKGKRKTLRADIEKRQIHTTTGKTLHPRLSGTQLVETDESEGLLVSEIQAGSPAQISGLRKGDIIVSVNHTTVNTLKDIALAVKPSKTLLLNIRRGNGALFLYFQ